MSKTKQIENQLRQMGFVPCKQDAFDYANRSFITLTDQWQSRTEPDSKRIIDTIPITSVDPSDILRLTALINFTLNFEHQARVLRYHASYSKTYRTVSLITVEQALADIQCKLDKFFESGLVPGEEAKECFEERFKDKGWEKRYEAWEKKYKDWTWWRGEIPGLRELIAQYHQEIEPLQD